MDVPVMTEPADALLWASRQTGPLSVETTETLLNRVGRIPAPVLFHGLWRRGYLTAEATRLVGQVWSMAEYPDSALGHETWRRMFADAGFTSEGEIAERPTRPVRLYRGSIADRRADWSWTDDLSVAQKYAAGGLAGRPPSQVWSVVAPPQHLLAWNDGRKESEYVVDTHGLEDRIEPYSAPSRPLGTE